MYKNKDITYETTFNNKSINTDLTKGTGCLIPVLDKLDAHLEDMRAKHSKVTLTRFDLRYPSIYANLQDPKQVSRFTENMKRSIQRKPYTGGHNPDIRIFVVPEKHHADKPHYHCLALSNGNAIQSSYTILIQAEKQWANALNIPINEVKGLVDHCNKHGENGMMLRRGDANEDNIANAMFHQVSYLAKVRGKDALAKGVRTIRCPHLPK